MTATMPAGIPPVSEPIDSEIHIRAWAMVNQVIGSTSGTLTILHAAAMLTSALAHQQPDPLEAIEDMLAEQSDSAMAILRTVLALEAEDTIPERKS